MNSEQIEHPATCGHCGEEITTLICPHCLHEEKSINVQLKEARQLARTLFSICFRTMGQFDRQGILSDNPWLNEEDDDSELQKFKDIQNERLEYVRTHVPL
jgi:hypothetical protein